MGRSGEQVWSNKHRVSRTECKSKVTIIEKEFKWLVYSGTFRLILQILTGTKRGCRAQNGTMPRNIIIQWKCSRELFAISITDVTYKYSAIQFLLKACQMEIINRVDSLPQRTCVLPTPSQILFLYQTGLAESLLCTRFHQSQEE